MDNHEDFDNPDVNLVPVTGRKETVVSVSYWQITDDAYGIADFITLQVDEKVEVYPTLLGVAIRRRLDDTFEFIPWYKVERVLVRHEPIKENED